MNVCSHDCCVLNFSAHPPEGSGDLPKLKKPVACSLTFSVPQTDTRLLLSFNCTKSAWTI